MMCGVKEHLVLRQHNPLPVLAASEAAGARFDALTEPIGRHQLGCN